MSFKSPVLKQHPFVFKQTRFKVSKNSYFQPTFNLSPSFFYGSTIEGIFLYFANSLIQKYMQNTESARIWGYVINDYAAHQYYRAKLKNDMTAGSARSKL